MDLALANEDQAADHVTMSPIELTNKTGMHLHHLNEDCLIEIFSCSSLTAMDLCSLAETCKRFKQITQRVFPKEFGIECYRKTKLGCKFATKIGHQDYIVRDVERILKHFGPHLATLKIYRDLYVVNSVAKYCGDVALRHLQISGLKSIDGVRIQLNSIFQHLLKLSVCDCNLLATSTGINCDSLIELRLVKSSGCVAILQNTFPKLERFTWDCSTINTGVPDIEGDILFNFIRRHGHLKFIDFDDKSALSSGALHEIDSSCKDLDELTLKLTSVSSLLTLDISTLGIITKLKTLHFLRVEFRCYDKYIPLMQALQTIKISQLDGSFGALALFIALSKLQNLRELHLMQIAASPRTNQFPWTMVVHLKKVHLCGGFFAFYGRDLPGIISQLVNLEELKIICMKSFPKLFLYSFCLSKEIFSEIGKIVEGRDHVLTLKCYFTFHYDENCVENQKVKLINLFHDHCDEEEVDDYSDSYTDSD